MAETLRDMVIETRKVQDGDSCLRVTVPSEAAADLDISDGDRVIFTGEVGDVGLQVQKAEAFMPVE